MQYIKMFADVDAANAAGEAGLYSPHLNMVKSTNTFNNYIAEDSAETFQATFDSSGNMKVKGSGWSVVRRYIVDEYYAYDVGTSMGAQTDYDEMGAVWAVSDSSITVTIEAFGGAITVPIYFESGAFKVGFYYDYMSFIYDTANQKGYLGYVPTLPNFTKSDLYDEFDISAFSGYVIQNITAYTEDTDATKIQNLKGYAPTYAEYSAIFDNYEKSSYVTDEEWESVKETHSGEFDEEYYESEVKYFVATYVYTYDGEEKYFSIPVGN